MQMSPRDTTNFEHYFVLYVVALLVASVLLFYELFNKSTNMKWLPWRYRKPKLDFEQVSNFLLQDSVNSSLPNSIVNLLQIFLPLLTCKNRDLNEVCNHSNLTIGLR